MIGAVGIKLRLDGKPPVFSERRAQEGPGVDLYGGKIGFQRHAQPPRANAAGRLRCEREAIVIILPDLPHAAEIKAPFGRQDLSCGNQRPVHLQNAAGVYHELRVQHAFAPVQIEIQVAGGCKHRVPVALALKINSQAPAAEGIGHRHAQIAGKAVVPVRRENGKTQGSLPQRLRLPDALMERVGPAVELVRPLIRRQRILPPIKPEARAAYAVGIAAYGGAEAGPVLGVCLRPFISQHRFPALAAQALYRRAQRDRLRAKRPRFYYILLIFPEFFLFYHFPRRLLKHICIHYSAGPHAFQLTILFLVLCKTL